MSDYHEMYTGLVMASEHETLADYLKSHTKKKAERTANLEVWRYSPRKVPFANRMVEYVCDIGHTFRARHAELTDECPICGEYLGEVAEFD